MIAERYWEERWRTEKAENERMRTAIQAYLDWCAPDEKWQGAPELLRIRRQMRAAFDQTPGRKTG